ncbi:MAG: tetratricopeptide repeat protein, partial [Chitinophagales bacterium]
DNDACLVNANIGLAIIYSFNERLPKAIKQIEGAMDCHPNMHYLHYWKGMLLVAKGNLKNSLLELNKAIKAQPDNYLYLQSRGYVFLHLGADRKAIEDLAYSYELNPLESKNYQGTYFFKKHQIRCGFMLAYFKQHQEELAWDIRELLEVGIGNLFKRMNYRYSWDKFTQALKLYKKEHPLIYYLMALSASKCEDKLHYYDKALKLDSNIYDAYRNRGLLYLNLGDTQKALADFEELIRLKPHFYVSYREKSSALLMQGNWNAVIKTCNKAIQLDKSDNEVFLNRGKALGMLKEHQKALEDYDYILQRTSENIPVFFEKGKAHLALEQYEEALIACDSILNISPNWIKAHNLRGVIYMKGQKYKAALACFDTSILLAPHYREAHFNRALTNFRLKDFLTALRDINKSLNLHEKDAEAYYLRAVIKKELGQKKACKDIQKALEMGMYLEGKEVDRVCE